MAGSPPLISWNLTDAEEEEMINANEAAVANGIRKFSNAYWRFIAGRFPNKTVDDVQEHFMVAQPFGFRPSHLLSDDSAEEENEENAAGKKKEETGEEKKEESGEEKKGSCDCGCRCSSCTCGSA